jgi:hypothetical protein
MSSPLPATPTGPTGDPRPGPATGPATTGLDGVRSAAALTTDDLLPTADALRPLLPDGGLRRGGTLGVAGSGATSVAFALLAGPSAAGSWGAVVGLDSLGLLAAADLGVDLARTALVPTPGPQWPTVIAALLDACDVVLVRPTGRATTSTVRRLTARVRERGRVMVWLDATAADTTPDVRITGTSSVWEGPGWGTGHLTGRQLRLHADGRRLAGHTRHTTVWLPDAHGRLSPAGVPAGDRRTPASPPDHLRIVPVGERSA